MLRLPLQLLAASDRTNCYWDKPVLRRRREPGALRRPDALLTPVELGTAAVACNPCLFSTEAREDGTGHSGGAGLVAAQRAVKASDARYASVAVQEMPCFFACTQFCTGHLRAPGKISYVLGRFTPDMEAAQAILDYKFHYATSGPGRIAYRDWSEGLKGHFITRSPPHGFVVE
jgi:predicted metal-binding protein